MVRGWTSLGWPWNGWFVKGTDLTLVHNIIIIISNSSSSSSSSILATVLWRRRRRNEAGTGRGGQDAIVLLHPHKVRRYCC